MQFASTTQSSPSLTVQMPLEQLPVVQSEAVEQLVVASSQLDFTPVVDEDPSFRIFDTVGQYPERQAVLEVQRALAMPASVLTQMQFDVPHLLLVQSVSCEQRAPSLLIFQMGCLMRTGQNFGPTCAKWVV